MKINSTSSLNELFQEIQEDIWKLKRKNLKININTATRTTKEIINLKKIRKNLFNYPEFIKLHQDFISKIESEFLLSVHIIQLNEDKISTIKRKYQRQITPLYFRVYGNKKTDTEIKRLIRTKTESFINNEILLLQTTNRLLEKSILKIDS